MCLWHVQLYKSVVYPFSLYDFSYFTNLVVTYFSITRARLPKVLILYLAVLGPVLQSTSVLTPSPKAPAKTKENPVAAR